MNCHFEIKKSPSPFFQVPIAIFYSACKKGDLTTIEKTIEDFPYVIHATNSLGESGFLFCLQNKQIEAMEALFKFGFNINKKNEKGETFFEKCFAILIDSRQFDPEFFFKCLSLMLANGADVNITINEKPIFHHLIGLYEEGLMAISYFKSIVRTGAFDSYLNSCGNGQLSLIRALQIEQIKKLNPLVSFLLKRDIRIPSIDDYVFSKHVRFSEIENRFQTTYIFYTKIKDLYEAHLVRTAFSDTFLSKRVLSFCEKTYTNLRDSKTRTLQLKFDKLSEEEKIMTLVNQFDELLASHIIDRSDDHLFPMKIKAKFDSKDFVDQTFTYACYEGSLSTVKAILDYSPSHLHWSDKLSPVHVASVRGKKEVVEFLIKKGADIHRKNAQEKSIMELISDELDVVFNKRRHTLFLVLDCLTLLLKNGASSKVCSYQKEGFFQILIKLAAKEPKIFSYIAEWRKDLSIDLDPNWVDKKKQSTFEVAMQTFKSNEELDIFFKSLGVFSFDFNAHSVCIELPKRVSHETIERLQEIQQELRKLRSSNNNNLITDQTLIKKWCGCIQKLKEMQSSEKEKESKRTEDLFDILMDMKIEGLVKRFLIKSKECESLNLSFDNKTHLELMKNHLMTFSFLTLEISYPELKMKISGIEIGKLSSSQLDNFRKRYFYKLKQLNSEVAPATLSEKKLNLTESKNESSLFGQEEKDKALRAKPARNPRTRPTKKELKTQLIEEKRKQKKMAKQVQKLNKELAPVKPKPAPKKSPRASLPPPISLPDLPRIGSELDADEIDKLVLELKRTDFNVLEKEDVKLEAPVIAKTSFDFKKTQIERLSLAINAFSSLYKLIAKLKSSSDILEGKDLFCIAQKKSFEYHLLRALEALAPTSESLKDDLRDGSFFQKLNQFFLNEVEIRSLRNAIRSSFTLIKGSNVLRLARLFKDNKIKEKLAHFRKCGLAPNNVKKLNDPVLLSFHFEYEKKLEAMNETSKNSTLLNKIKNECLFITSCIKASENKASFSIYLDAIKKSLSDFSKLTSFLSEEPFKAFQLSREVQDVIHLGNKVAHHFDQTILIGQPIDEIDISKIWNDFQPGSTFLKTLLNHIGKVQKDFN